MSESNYILNVDWLTIRGTHNLDLAKRNFAGKEWRDMVDKWEKTRAEKSARDQMKDQAEMFTGVIQHTIGNCILDVQPYGTRQYLVLFHVYIGRELFGYLQAFPRTSVIHAQAFTLKIANMWLYQPDVWRQLAYVCGALKLAPKAISRLDVAADFNKFVGDLHPEHFIAMFVRGQIRHKGRSDGMVHFRPMSPADAKGTDIRDRVKFNALTFGKHSSDAHCYLYNKTLELEEQTKKPWIIDCWTLAGLDPTDVWRLEFSLKSDALRFADRNTGDIIDFSLANLNGTNTTYTMRDLYFAMLHSLFFFYYPTGQKNVSREREIDLFGDEIAIDRAIMRESNPSSRGARIFLKNLYCVRKHWRNLTLDEELQAQDIGAHLARTMRLEDWYKEKQGFWQNEKLKV